MKRWIAVLVVVLAVAPGGARADDASKQAKVKELFTVMHMNHVLDPMLKGIQQEMQGMIQNAMGNKQMTPAQTKLTQDYMAQSMAVVNQNLGWSSLEPDYTKLYEAATDKVVPTFAETNPLHKDWVSVAMFAALAFSLYYFARKPLDSEKILEQVESEE